MSTAAFRLDGSWGPAHGRGVARVLSWSDGDPGDPFDLLQEAIERGGFALAVGFLGYDLGRRVEDIPALATRALDLPDLWVGFWDDVSWAPPAEARSGPTPTAAGAIRPTLPKPRYTDAVAEIRRRLAAGDLYQANLTQRISVPLAPGADPAALYRRLIAERPAPFAAYLDCGRFQVLGASPERFLRYDPGTRRLTTEPIKGTAPAGRLDDLLGSAKDRAEHVMIVDLARNDLGRVCEPGSVVVDDMLRPMTLPSVHHLVSTVRGELRPGVGLADVLRATFPGGSITGTPKVAAMHAIEALEPVRRGVYCGALGWFRPDGAFDLNLAIRTAVMMDDTLHVHAGGGIVIDSTPEGEHDECWLKARSLLEAVGAEAPAGYSSSAQRSACHTPPPSWRSR